MRGIDRQRGKHRADLGLVILLDPFPAGRGQFGKREEANALGREGRAEVLAPTAVLLLDHPAVAQAVTFALPHDKLGEEVAAAIVLKDGSAVSDRELRDFAAGRLADFKVPRRIVFLAEIPKGATGKLQRIELAQKLGLAS